MTGASVIFPESLASGNWAASGVPYQTVRTWLHKLRSAMVRPGRRNDAEVQPHVASVVSTNWLDKSNPAVPQNPHSSVFIGGQYLRYLRCRPPYLSEL
jgi:hypothetical protein